MKIVIDSYAWIEIFSGTQKGRRALAAIEEADEVLTPDIVLSEVARKYMREGADENKAMERLETISETSEILGIDAATAVESAKMYLLLEKNAKEKSLTKPGLFDGIVLAFARVNQARVLTGDQHFKDLEDTLWL
ncbi:MAG: PIN domain-containing protein [Candidatus Thermoplasmatota archaeon]|nr:PIN domain-containing protein [Candidatus Sysuiplasma jiujiangense]MBX8642742.1 PIN domain-containing protein [Candidatus Sysuiplasma jiujiangense]MCL4316917.1 PIN domain-containing protein [Candidatus Thermoplasmatota archaeon]